MTQKWLAATISVCASLCLPALAQMQRTPTVQPGQSGNPNSAIAQQAAVDNASHQQSTMNDKAFVRDAAEGGMTEVELGKLAQDKATSDAVKQFGQKMVDDHTKANDELKKVAGAESITIPEKLDSKHQARVDKLAKLSGDEFDRAYVKDQLKDHEQDVHEFSEEAQSGSDAAVKNFASQTLPTIQQHLAMVKDLNKTTKSR